MKNNKTIVVLGNDRKVVGFVDVGKETIFSKIGEVLIGLDQKINTVLDKLKTSPAELRVSVNTDENKTIAIKDVKLGDEGYIYAVSEELNNAGLTTKVVPEILKNSLILVSDTFTTSERLKVLGDLLNVPDDIEPEAVKELESILKDMAS